MPCPKCQKIIDIAELTNYKTGDYTCPHCNAKFHYIKDVDGLYNYNPCGLYVITCKHDGFCASEPN